jgi:hypothetical protein
LPGGSFESKPTWWSASRDFATSAFFVLAARRCREREGTNAMEMSMLTWAQQILATAEKPETPLHEQRGLLENISRMQHSLTPDELWRYVQMSRAVRARLAHTLSKI